jgi:Arc/MetJ-type ribon-helix-helix transcriptional regulator
MSLFPKAPFDLSLFPYMSLASTRLHSLVCELSHCYHRYFTFYLGNPFELGRAPALSPLPSRFYILCRASARSIPGFLGLKAWPLLSLPAVGGHSLQRCSVKALERENEGDSHIDRLYGCPKLCYMRETLTVSLPREMRREVTRAAKRQKLTASEYVRDAVRRKLWLDAFDETRRKLLPKARALGIYTDEDVFKIVS